MSHPSSLRLCGERGGPLADGGAPSFSTEQMALTAGAGAVAMGLAMKMFSSHGSSSHHGGSHGSNHGGMGGSGGGLAGACCEAGAWISSSALLVRRTRAYFVICNVTF